MDRTHVGTTCRQRSAGDQCSILCKGSERSQNRFVQNLRYAYTGTSCGVNGQAFIGRAGGSMPRGPGGQEDGSALSADGSFLLRRPLVWYEGRRLAE